MSGKNDYYSELIIIIWFYGLPHIISLYMCSFCMRINIFDRLKDIHLYNFLAGHIRLVIRRRSKVENSRITSPEGTKGLSVARVLFILFFFFISLVVPTIIRISQSRKR